MNATAVVHDTIRLKQVFAVSSAAVYDAWANPLARQIWAPPSRDQAIVFERSDFRTGGHETARCGARDDLSFRLETQYLKIIPNALIMCNEQVSREGSLLSTALVCAVLSPLPSGSELELVIQLTSLCGAEMVEGYKIGWTSALENLARHLVVKV